MPAAFRGGYWAAIFLLAAACYAGAAHAISIEKLLMPGELIKGHAKYESECTKCHERFSKTTQNSRCLACHKDEARDIRDKTGFHGRLKDIDSRKCKVCHTDHIGRNADIVRLDRATFDHGGTDYPLKGAHRKVECELCHRPKKGKKIKYRDAPSKCFDCHEKDDYHKGNLGKDCKKCHSEKSWAKESRFDHDKTDFPLHGAHKKVSCNSCHPNERYKKTPKQCYSCHQLNDVHRARYGEKCKDCHNEKKWKDVIFDHDKDTKYPLKGRHRKVNCDSCHKGILYKEKLAKKCYGCHKADDEHKGRYGRKCEDCHSPREWKKVRFDHAKDTKFPLHGKHEKVACEACHQGDVYADLAKDCFSCHRTNDVHQGKQGQKCENCHNEQGWTKKITFDHDVTRFPLLGLHAAASCEDCHLTAVYRGTERKCVGCHKDDDEHKGRLGPQCGTCHNPNAWNVWEFDHNKQTEFKLDGAHKDLHCYACHKDAVKEIDLPKTCYRCHEEDDVHMGNFGRRCERCHVTSSFEELVFGTSMPQ